MNTHRDPAEAEKLRKLIGTAGFKNFLLRMAAARKVLKPPARTNE